MKGNPAKVQEDVAQPLPAPAEVARELERLGNNRSALRPAVGRKHKLSLGWGLVAVLVLLTLRGLIPWESIPFLQNHQSFIVALMSAGILSAFVLMISLVMQALSETPVDELEVREHPSVFFRVSDNTWLEVIVRYLVHPRRAGRAKNELIRKLLAKLNARPEKVLFPKSNLR